MSLAQPIMMDERTELLINRRLDGELSAEEALELNKRLIRSPEARALLEEYERNDRLAQDTLRTWSRANSPRQDDESAAQIGTRSRLSRIGIAVRATAAVILLTTMAGVPSWWRTTPSSPPNPGAPTLAAASILPVSPSVEMDGPRKETHQLQRNVVGVWDEETQSIYVLELDQHASKVIPDAMNF